MYVNTVLERKRPRIQATFWGNVMLCLHWVAAKIERNLCFRVRFARCMSSLKARSHGAIFFVNATAIKMSCVDVNETVHMVWLRCICVWCRTWMGSIPILCDCDVWFQYVSIQIAVTLCELTALNCKKKLSLNAIAKEINRTVWMGP